MDIGTLLLVVAIAAALSFQGRTTYRVWKSDAYDRDQKMNQTKLIWFVPVLGAFLAFSVLAQENERFRPDSHDERKH